MCLHMEGGLVRGSPPTRGPDTTRPQSMPKADPTKKYHKRVIHGLRSPSPTLPPDSEDAAEGPTAPLAPVPAPRPKPKPKLRLKMEPKAVAGPPDCEDAAESPSQSVQPHRPKLRLKPGPRPKATTAQPLDQSVQAPGHDGTTAPPLDRSAQAARPRLRLKPGPRPKAAAARY